VALNFGEVSERALKQYPVASDADVLTQCAFLFGDTQFTYGARGIAQANSARGFPTYRYLFARRRGDGGVTPKHGEEVPYVFGRITENARDKALSETMMDAWVRFAATGDPNGANLPNWPRYDANSDCYFEFGDELRVGNSWRAAQMDFLDAYFDTK
ncbi:MAG TPA: carboxylesterase family protein, partial [Candidatus Binataceae bacterium]|nr:carboxylesterase family protein [Candidatus Binataceae bacterium]